MDRIKIKACAEIFTKVSGHSIRALESSKKNVIPTQVPITTEKRNIETCIVFATVLDAGKVCSYQSGSFTLTSSRVVKYVFILYSYGANAILSDPLKRILGKDILHAYTTYHDYLKERLFQHKIHWLDNESSNALNK